MAQKSMEIMESARKAEESRHSAYEQLEAAKHRKLKRVFKEINAEFNEHLQKQNEKRGQMADRHASEEHNRREKA